MHISLPLYFLRNTLQWTKWRFPGPVRQALHWVAYLFDFNSTKNLSSPDEVQHSDPVHRVLHISELLEHIANSMEPQDLISARLTCKAWNTTIDRSSTILHNVIPPTKPIHPDTSISKAIGLAEADYFVTDDEVARITIGKKMYSIQQPSVNTKHAELFYHVHLERCDPTTLPPLSAAQRQNIFLPRVISIRITAINWWFMAPAQQVRAKPELWTKFVITIKPCSVHEMVHLIEKIGTILQVLSKQEVHEDLVSDAWKLQLTTREMSMLYEAGDLDVSFHKWWVSLAESYYR